ncbi:ATP synthase subunit delta, mitochondrial [Aphelenchoides besseyi]|nr:ATP synthase subunit delta, mitochondrial [Aphelenchoides besseyi]KAI6211444.1 ATP synthase subunit delta, mitochondrial [Aphelenchoides besseyi]
MSLNRLIRQIVPRFVAIRNFAAAAPASNKNPDELRLTLASPNKSYYSNDVVKQVDVPTLAGTVGILANHVPVIAVLKPGVVDVISTDGNHKKMFVSSGTLSMNIDGSCQVLAEEIVELTDIDESLARQELDAAQRASGQGSEVERAEAQIRVEVADALIKAASGQH